MGGVHFYRFDWDIDLWLLCIVTAWWSWFRVWDLVMKGNVDVSESG